MQLGLNLDLIDLNSSPVNFNKLFLFSNAKVLCKKIENGLDFFDMKSSKRFN
jgi:hypothetical protein